MKKLVSSVLAASMVMSLAACGSTASTDSAADSSTASAASSAATTEAAGEGSGAYTGTPIKIGGIGPLTGAYANYGLSEKNGAELAVKEINEAGGIAGKQIELSYQDSQGESESAVNAYGKLMDWGMEVSLGCVLSGENASVVAAARDDDVLLITPSGSADKCIDGNDKAFRVCFYNSYQGAAAAQYIKDNNMVDTVGILYQSDNDYSVGLYNAFVAKCGELGITIAETQTFTSSTSTDFSTQVNALVSSGVKLVFIPFYAEEASTFLTQARGKFADGVYFFGADGLDGILGKVAQDPTIANNVLMLTPFSADNPAENVQSFVKKYQEAYGATPDQFAADAYDAIYAIKAAVEKAGSTSGAALASALTSLTVEGVTGTMTWGSDGNTNKPASAILYYDGVGTLFDSQD